ncbi:MAG TPA: MBL fold metallo-hydrolase, partial [Paenibacillus sp.]|nr:MBL fold metallo-hydrolase [Paenibacillus sp.]
MKIQLIRSASLRIVYDGKEIWVDPMFAEAGAYPPIPNTANPRNNPLVDIPLELDLLPTPDAIMLTHGHPDHFDTAAAERIPKDTPFFCQPEDRDTLVGQGFTNVSPIEDAAEWNGIRMYRTGGRHGTGVIGEQMGPVSGFVLRSELEPTLYLAGDTIWCEETEEAVRRFDPSVMVCYAGDACFLEGGPIIMNK